ncbi:hypothetical protein P0082_02135 [Candidatus Haliotispira prima]|uniref:Uncharacterized protein n=1 Tax=Candidatus Haliotispira prima TaxID=3034016 RepID=A0ABY8MJA4_9SPIO|nr:hypothetical protein P0082_02135 [Candidatus Haliotispira prima]
MSEESGKTGKTYCANCINCKLVKALTDDGVSIQKVRCDAGHWKKKLGEEKLYRYATVARRTMRLCPDYDEMGEPKAFMKELKKTLPSKDDAYTVD